MNDATNHIERTLVLFKPHAVQRAIVGEILSRFERVGLKIVATKMLRPDEKHYFQHYERIGKVVSRRGQKVYDMAVGVMTDGPVLAFVFEGVEAVAIVRKLVGTTEPKTAAPGTIRGDYAHMSFAYGDAADKDVHNVIHASGDSEEAQAEIALWFRPEEIYDYETPHQKFFR